VDDKLSGQYFRKIEIKLNDCIPMSILLVEHHSHCTESDRLSAVYQRKVGVVTDMSPETPAPQPCIPAQTFFVSQVI
jgi:hypothetical protein